MNYIQNTNSIDSSFYPQARYQSAKIPNYSNTNNIDYSNNNCLTNNNYVLDPIAMEMSNNITRNYNERIQSANMLNEALEMIKNSVMDEALDEAMYNMMINQAMQDEDKEIIMSIASDEKKHNMLLRQIYFSLTGTNIPPTPIKDNILTNTYLNNLKKSLFGELKAIKKYRKILASMNDKENYNKMMEIMTDEITHANKYNYLITKYLVNKEETKETKRD